MTKRERRRLSEDGLPKDAREFTPEMWMILFRHIDDAVREMVFATCALLELRDK